MEVIVIIGLLVAILVLMYKYIMKGKNQQETNKTEKQDINKLPNDTKTNETLKNREEENVLDASEQGEPETTEEKYPYRLTQSIFSPKEKMFYLALKPIADKMGLIVFTKMRIADLLYMPKSTKDYIKWFNYIKAKHVDFILVDDNMKIKLLIEVDDKTHNRENRIKRDLFVDKIFKQHNLNVLHIWQWGTELEELIANEIKSNS